MTRDVKKAVESLKKLVHPDLPPNEVYEYVLDELTVDNQPADPKRWIMFVTPPGKQLGTDSIIVQCMYEKYPEASDEQLAAFMYGMALGKIEVKKQDRNGRYQDEQDVCHVQS